MLSIVYLQTAPAGIPFLSLPALLQVQTTEPSQLVSQSPMKLSGRGQDMTQCRVHLGA